MNSMRELLIGATRDRDISSFNEVKQTAFDSCGNLIELETNRRNKNDV